MPVKDQYQQTDVSIPPNLTAQEGNVAEQIRLILEATPRPSSTSNSDVRSEPIGGKNFSYLKLQMYS